MAMALLPPCGAPCKASSSTNNAVKYTQFHTTGALFIRKTINPFRVYAIERTGREELELLSDDSKDSMNLGAPEEDSGINLDGRVSEGADLESIVEWQLDFCSRPIFDERGKRLWELILCDGSRQLEFARFYPNNVINSITLKNAIAEVIDIFGLPKPLKIRYFRTQVKTIISKACAELDIQAVPSQRCTTLIRWLQERYEQVYKQHPGFQEDAAAVSLPDLNIPKPIPDNLRGEKWAFVQLSFEALQEEMKSVETGSTFGSVFVDMQQLPSPDTLIPGVAVASSRALPLSAWTNSLELACMEVDKIKSCLVLTTGASQKWFYAYYKKSKETDEEANAWEAAKKASGGLHFLAIQPSLESDSCTGFWLLYDLPTSPV